MEQEVSDMKAVYRILKGLEEDRTEQKDFILESYESRLEDYTTPWEMYLAKNKAKRSNRRSA